MSLQSGRLFLLEKTFLIKVSDCSNNVFTVSNVGLPLFCTVHHLGKIEVPCSLPVKLDHTKKKKKKTLIHSTNFRVVANIKPHRYLFSNFEDATFGQTRQSPS